MAEQSKMDPIKKAAELTELGLKEFRASKKARKKKEPVLDVEKLKPLKSAIDLAMEKTEGINDKKEESNIDANQQDQPEEIIKNEERTSADAYSDLVRGKKAPAYFSAEKDTEKSEGEILAETGDAGNFIKEDNFLPDAEAVPTSSFETGAAERSQKILEAMKKELEESRMNYAMSEYKANNVFSKIKFVLGLKTEAKDLEEVKEFYKKYKECMANLMQFQLDELEKKQLAEGELKKEMGDIVKYFTAEEQMELFDEHTSAKAKIAEDKFGKFPGWLAEKGTQFFNWYRKVGCKKKMLFGLGLTMTGAGVAVLTGYRAIGATAAGIGVAQSVDNMFRKKEQKENVKRQKEIIRRAETDPELLYARIKESLEEEIEGYEDRLKQRRIEKLFSKISGLTAGLAVFALGKIAHELGFGKYVAEKLGLSGEVQVGHSKIAPIEIPDNSSGEMHIDNATNNIVDNATGNETIQNSTEKIISNVVEKINPIEIEKSSSFEGAIINYLQQNGASLKEAGKTAHRMALAYAKEHGVPFKNLDHTYPGQEIFLNPDGTKILSLSDNFDSRSIATIKNISLGSRDNWAAIRGMNFEEVKKGMGAKIGKSLTKVLEKYHEIMGKEAEPKASETVQKWLGRVAKNSLEIKKDKLFL